VNASAFVRSSLGHTPPKTNGKAERFIQTALREWACAHRVIATGNSD